MRVRDYFVVDLDVKPALLDLFDETADGDEWGNCLGWHFAVAHVLYHFDEVPSEWQYNHGLCDDDMRDPASNDEAELIYLMEDCGITTDDLVSFGNMLNNLHDILIHEGKDY
jgi:hypothetical protein